MCVHDLLHNPRDVDGPEDLDFPSTEHHMSVQAEIRELVRAGCLDPGEADEAYDAWLRDRQQRGSKFARPPSEDGEDDEDEG